jgi:hypothetical protein
MVTTHNGDVSPQNPNFNIIVECQFPNIRVQQLEDTFTIVRRNLRARRTILGLGSNDADDRKMSQVGGMIHKNDP